MHQKLDHCCYPQHRWYWIRRASPQCNHHRRGKMHQRLHHVVIILSALIIGAEKYISDLDFFIGTRELKWVIVIVNGFDGFHTSITRLTID